MSSAPGAGAWATEVLGVLAPLIQHSQEAAEQLVTLGGLHSLAELIKQPEGEPLPLSLMLDIIEVLVSRGEAAVQTEVRQMLVRDGLLSPMLQSLRQPGLNKKTVAILTFMVEVCTVPSLHSCALLPCDELRGVPSGMCARSHKHHLSIALSCSLTYCVPAALTVIVAHTLRMPVRWCRKTARWQSCKPSSRLVRCTSCVR